MVVGRNLRRFIVWSVLLSAFIWIYTSLTILFNNFIESNPVKNAYGQDLIRWARDEIKVLNDNGGVVVMDIKGNNNQVNEHGDNIADIQDYGLALNHPDKQIQNVSDKVNRFHTRNVGAQEIHRIWNIGKDIKLQDSDNAVANENEISNGETDVSRNIEGNQNEDEDDILPRREKDFKKVFNIGESNTDKYGTGK